MVSVQCPGGAGGGRWGRWTGERAAERERALERLCADVVGSARSGRRGRYASACEKRKEKREKREGLQRHLARRKELGNGDSGRHRCGIKARLVVVMGYDGGDGVGGDIVGGGGGGDGW